MSSYRADQLTIKGERAMSQGFIAQYAAEAALRTDGVESLDTGVIVSLKEALGGEHEGRGVRVTFGTGGSELVTITVYPIVQYGYILPEVAWNIQEKVKQDVERFTGLIVDAVNVEVMGVVAAPDELIEADTTNTGFANDRSEEI